MLRRGLEATTSVSTEIFSTSRANWTSVRSLAATKTVWTLAAKPMREAPICTIPAGTPRRMKAPFSSVVALTLVPFTLTTEPGRTWPSLLRTNPWTVPC